MKTIGRAVLAAGALALMPFAAQAEDAGWPVYGYNYANTRFSPLKQINSKNVDKLKLAYSF